MWVEILLFICLAIMLIWWRLTRNHNYWAERGVITPPIRLPFGKHNQHSIKPQDLPLI